MPQFPDTRPSLLARVHATGAAGQDEDAWREFVAIYRPAVYRLARGRGLQHADAEDLAQGVFAAVHRAIGRWEADPARGRFRAWLATATRNAAVNALTRKPRDVAAGGTSAQDLLAILTEPDDDRAEAALRREYRRSLFRQAAGRVRGEFSAGIWQAFHLTAVEGHSVEEAASILGKTAGAVYAARSRVMRRLRSEVERLEVDVAGPEAAGGQTDGE